MNLSADFLIRSTSCADPGRAAALLAPGLQPDTGRRLFTSPRTASRAFALLEDRLGSGDIATLDPADRALALAPADALRGVASAAGAVWHAADVMRLLRATDIAAFVERHGAWARAAALRHASLAPADPALGAALLVDAVARDGARCLAAWLAGLPHWVSSRLRLTWPEAHALPDEAAMAGWAGRAQAEAIVRAILPDRPGP